MLKAAKYFLMVFAAFLFLTTCKKYPEGGFEVRGPKMLLKHNGAWILTLYEVNGIDSTNLINYNGNEKYKESYFLKEYGRFEKDLLAENYPATRYKIEFQDNNTVLAFIRPIDTHGDLGFYCYNTIDSYYSGCYRLFFMPEGIKCSWSIIKLTKKELILTCSQKNNYKLKFKAR